MDQYPAVAMTGQGTPGTPYHGGTGALLNPEGGPLQSANPGGRGYPNTSATGGNHRRTPGSGVDCSGSAGTTHGADGSTIGGEGRTSKGLAKGVDKGKGTRTKTVVQNGECDEAGIPRGAHPDGTDTENDGTNS